MLTQLKNGDWVNLANVHEVKVFNSYDENHQWAVGLMRMVPQPAGIALALWNTVPMPSQAEAEAYRDKLAALVNAVQEESLKPASPPKSWHDERPLI